MNAAPRSANAPRPTERTVSLLTYAHRFAPDLAALDSALREGLPEFTGTHVLPFFDPIDGVDAGFDPVDHTRVDPRVGTWKEVKQLADRVAVTADLIVNHASAQSPQFQDWLAHGEQSEHAGLFLTFDAVFPDGASEADITAFYRPRPGLPFTPYIGADGTKHLVWTTFEPEQVDIDVRSPQADAYLGGILDAFADAGITTVRLDAIGYAIKQPGSDSFMTEQTLTYVDTLVTACHQRGLEVLVEVHSHYALQLRIAEHADRIYDFALPPLLLHAVYTGDLAPLAQWLPLRPSTAISVLDTHDGIGVVDACKGADDTPGFLTEDQADAIFAEANARTRGVSSQASVIPQFNPRPHQINATFPSVLGHDDEALTALRAIQLLLPGPAHVYYVGLLGGGDDVELWRSTGVGREINRHYYDAAERSAALQQPVARAQRALVRIATEHPALDGDFTWQVEGSTVTLAWNAGSDAAVELLVRFEGGSARARLDLDGRVLEGTAQIATLLDAQLPSRGAHGPAL